MTSLSYIRKANKADISRISEIYVFNNRLSYYPIFHNINFSFNQLQVLTYAEKLSDEIDKAFVYDDGIIKGFMLVEDNELKKLHVDYFFQNLGIGGCLLEYSIEFCGVNHLWTLQKNTAAIRFYEKHGFNDSDEKASIYGINGKEETLIRLVRKEEQNDL